MTNGRKQSKCDGNENKKKKKNNTIDRIVLYLELVLNYFCLDIFGTVVRSFIKDIKCSFIKRIYLSFETFIMFVAGKTGNQEKLFFTPKVKQIYRSYIFMYNICIIYIVIYIIQNNILLAIDHPAIYCKSQMTAVRRDEMCGRPASPARITLYRLRSPHTLKWSVNIRF